MGNEPQIQARAAQHYAAIRRTVTMDGISAPRCYLFGCRVRWRSGRWWGRPGLSLVGGTFVLLDVLAQGGDGGRRPARRSRT